ncbi:MAG: hypothetical protein Q8P10_00885 [bacterium]|nr:hypothetical protein [bacterium]
MDNTSSLQAIRDVLQRNDPIGIVVGQNPNLDEMGASLSLYLSLQQMNKNVVIACPTDPLVEISSLVGIDKVKKNLGGSGGDLIVSFPYKEGEIEKVSYTLEEGFLNIVVKAGGEGLSFSENEVKYERGGGGAPKILFIIGTSRLSDLGNLFDPQNLKGTTVVNIDNKRENQGFGDIVFVSASFSSVCEQIYDLLSYLGFDSDIDISQNLLSGISFATDNFQSPKTSFSAFETAAKLMKKGALRQKAYQEVPKTPFFEDDFDLPPVQPQPQPQPQTQGQRPNWSQNLQRQNQKPFRSQQSQQPQQRKPYQGFQSGQGQRFGQNPRPQPRPLQNVNVPQNSNVQNSNIQNDDEEAPADWLTPKIYKGSTSI